MKRRLHTETSSPIFSLPELPIDVQFPLYDRCRDIMEAHRPSVGSFFGELPPRSQSASWGTCIASSPDVIDVLRQRRPGNPSWPDNANKKEEFVCSCHFPFPIPIPISIQFPTSTTPVANSSFSTCEQPPSSIHHPARDRPLSTKSPLHSRHLPSCWAPDQLRALRPGPPRWHDARDSPGAASSPPSHPARHKPPAPTPTSRLASPVAWPARPSSTASTPSPPQGA